MHIFQQTTRTLASLLLPYLKKSLSIAVILNKLKDEIPYSIQTSYTWVDKGYLPGIDNITLTRKVRYTPRKKKIKSSEIDREYYNGREYRAIKKLGFSQN